MAYCQANDWAGYDPYDALNSRIFERLPFLHFRFPRLVLTQVIKRLPINIRPLLLVPKTQNAKAIALLLMAFLKLSRLGLLQDETLIGAMIEKLVALRSQDHAYWSWGYSFPWQTRTVIVPRAAPNIVCTCFVANALLDAYEMNREERCLEMAASAAEYLLNELYWTDNDAAGFSYPLKSLETRVHNANFLGAALFFRVSYHNGEKKFLGPALRAARYAAAKQNEDGGWWYGEVATQRWIDNFHTGYNLCALQSIDRYAKSSEFEPYIRSGFDFYRAHFFRDDGAPRYFHDRTYPIDIHSVAQSIITLLAFKDFDGNNVDTAVSVFKWARTRMWDEENFFYYQIHPLWRNKISYMRWSQAWMILALSALLEEIR
jgi:hypothetical protein